jgi:1-acyl-sn-glycerol-3-phosphate acyltransferase
MARRMWSPPLLWASGVKLEVSGLQNVPRDRSVIFVCNHQSMIDIALVFKVLPVNLHFVLKKELAYAPFIGLFAWATGMIFVDRKNSKAAIASVRKVGDMVRQGRSIMAFPEGTRCREPMILPFKKGIFVSALSAQVPVVPIAMEGAGRVLPSSGFAVRPSVVRVSIGKPIFTEGMAERDRDALISQAQTAVSTMYEEIRLPTA